MTEGEKQRNTEALIAYCGYGNPEKAEIFFMGIEEHKEIDVDALKNFTKIKNIVYNYSNVLEPDDAWNPKSTTEKREIEIYQKITKNNNHKPNEIFNTKIHCFNYYPLGARNVATLPKVYNSLFGFNFKEKKEMYTYFNKCTNRAEILKNFINDYILNKSKMLFVFGKCIWGLVDSNIISKLGIKMKHSPNEKIEYKINENENKRIWFFKHPSRNHFSTKMVNEIF